MSAPIKQSGHFLFRLMELLPVTCLVIATLHRTELHGKGIKRLYIGKSPYNDRVAPGNNQQVRNFWLTFSGSIKAEAFPKNAAFFKVIIHQFENYIVDMYFKNIRVTEK